MKFLEIISGEKLGKANRGQMRVQKIENLNKCLDFLKYKRIQVCRDDDNRSKRLTLQFFLARKHRRRRHSRSQRGFDSR